jgi:general stress protein YciG
MDRKGDKVRKNPAAVALGRLGGMARAANLTPEELAAISRKGGQLGGKARAVKLSSKRRREIAQKAAAARWGKREG